MALPVLEAHTPSNSFAIPYSLSGDNLSSLFLRLSSKLHSNVGPGWVKYEYNSTFWDLDDDADYSIFTQRLAPSDNSSPSPVIYVHDPLQPLPAPPAHQNFSYYAFRNNSKASHSALNAKLEHTPPDPQGLDNAIADFLEQCRPKMQQLVKDASTISSLLPSWTPAPFTDEKLAKHISKLCIPTVTGGEPSLLLHDLGEERDNLDRDRIARVPEIFSFAYHTVLINTSGSGKTRLLLEGLCRRWGFYFVAKPDMSGIGSKDLWEVMTNLGEARDYNTAKEMKEANLDSQRTQAAIEHIREAVKRRLFQLLLARFLLLNLLVQEAQELPENLQESKHRRLWVLLQAQPKRLFGINFKVDVFTDLTKLLQRASIPELKDRIREQFVMLSHLLQKVHNPATSTNEVPPFFCVLDEVQITLKERLDDFVSSDKKTKRPILREVWLSWCEVLDAEQMRLILSGTGIELQALEETLLSAACKMHPHRLKHDVGAFEDSRIQAQYIKRYLLADWSDPQWAEFLIRAWAWLRGRYRNTATLISLILEVGYKCPHRTLDEYIQVFTEFHPSDGKEWVDREPPLPLDFELRPRLNRLTFEKINEMQAETLCTALYNQILYGSYTLDSFASEVKKAFVEYGIARHKLGTTVLDEPLAILAALQWVKKSPRLSLFNYLHRDIGKHASRKNGFEAYLAYYMQMVFEAAPKLNAVFTFRSDFARRADLDWQHEQFELVTVAGAAGSSSPHISVVTQSSSSSPNLGILAKSDEEVLEWISTNNSRSAVCFPPESFGPDLLFFVRSKMSEKLLLVVVQAKKYNDVGKEILIQGVRSITPTWLWKSKDKKHSIADSAPFINKDYAELASRTVSALENIPFGLKAERADFPILRVFASWPGEANIERSLDWKDNRSIDEDPHPLATLHLENFNKMGETLDYDWFRGNVQQRLVMPSKKRVREEGSES